MLLKAILNPADSRYIFNLVQFSCSVMPNSLWPHESQHTSPPCPSPTPRVHSEVRPSSQWCHSAISSSVVPLSSWPQSLPASESFPRGKGYFLHEASKVLEFQLQHQSFQINTQDWCPLGWTGWTSLQSKVLSGVFSNTTVQKHQFFGAQLSSQSNYTSIHDHWKNHSLD